MDRVTTPGPANAAGRGVAAMAGRPWLTLACCAGAVWAVWMCWICAGVAPTRGPRAIATCAGVGRA
jgi:hypothetical protein